MTPEQQALRQAIEKFSDILQSKYAVRTDFPTWNLNNVDKELSFFDGLAEGLKHIPIESFNSNTSNELKNIITRIVTTLDQASSRLYFTSENEPVPVGEDILKEIRGITGFVLEQRTPAVPMLLLARNLIAANTRAFEQEVETARTRIKAKADEIAIIDSKVRDLAETRSTAAFAKDFETAVESLDESAKRWLVAALFLFSVTLLASFCLWLFTPGEVVSWFKPATQIELPSGAIAESVGWHQITSKFIFLGLLITATLWCANMFKILKHHAAGNRHRAVTLRTIEAFDAAIKDESLKDTVKTEAAKAAFRTLPSGYVQGSGDGGDGSLQVFEVMRRITPSQQDKS